MSTVLIRLRKYSGFLALDHDFIRSDVVASLSPRAKLLLFGMVDKYNGRNNGQIPYSVKEATAWLSCCKATARAALDELQDAGLIQVAVDASFDWKAGARDGQARKWRLLYLPAKRRKPTTHHSFASADDGTTPTNTDKG